MLVFLIIAAVLIGLAYADFCLIDNTEHFGICFNKVAEAEETAAGVRAEAVASRARKVDVASKVDVAGTADDLMSGRFRRRPVPESLLLLELEPVLELHEAS
jgi:hypothetical protein